MPESIPVASLLKTHPEYNPKLQMPVGVTAPSLTVYNDLYVGGAAFDANQNWYLERRPTDSIPEVRAARLRCAAYVNHVAAIVDWMAGDIFTQEPAIEGPEGNEYWNLLNDNADGSGRDFGAVIYQAALSCMKFGRAYLALDFPDAPADSLATSKSSSPRENRGKADAYLCAFDADAVDDWQLDENGALKWVRVHTVEHMRPMYGIGDWRNRHTWTYLFKDGKETYTALTGPNSAQFDSSTNAMGTATTYNYGGALPVIPVQIPAGLWVLNRIYRGALAVFNADAASTSLHRQTCLQVPVIISDSPAKVLTISEYAALHLSLGSTFGFQGPQGPALADARAFGEAQESKLYKTMQALPLLAPGQVQNARQSGSAKEQDLSAPKVMVNAYRAALNDAAETAIRLLQQVRGEEDLEITITGLESKAPEQNPLDAQTGKDTAIPMRTTPQAGPTRTVA